MLSRKGNKVNWRPYGIVFVIFAALFSAAISVIVLVTSNDYPVADWPRIRPTVLLAVCTVVANVTVHQILAIGLPIRWWLEVEHRGGSVDKLKKIYSDGSSIWSSFQSLFSASPSTAALACIAVTAVAGSGPFLQKASFVVAQTYSNITVEIATHLATDLPVGFSGITNENVGWTDVLAFSPLFSNVVKNFSARQDILLNNSVCVGTCKAMIEGVGFALNCSNGTYEYDLSDTSEVIEGGMVPIQEVNLFSSQVELRNPKGDTTIGVKTNFKNLEDPVGVGITKDCYLIPSIVRYSVTLTNTTALLRGSIRSDKVIRNLTISEEESHHLSTLGGFVFAAQQKYSSEVNVTRYGVQDWEFSAKGSLAYEFHDLNEKTYAARDFPKMAWEDPTETIIQGLRELMFRTAITLGNSSTPPSICNGTMTNTEQVYKTDFLFMGLGVGAIMIGILGVAPVLWGGWNLKHKASLDPLDFLVWARKNENSPNTPQFLDSEYIKLVESDD